MPGKAQTGSGFSVNRERRTPSASHPARLCRCPGRWHVVSTERWLLTEQGSEQIGENTINTGVMPMRCRDKRLPQPRCITTLSLLHAGMERRSDSFVSSEKSRSGRPQGWLHSFLPPREER